MHRHSVDPIGKLEVMLLFLIRKNQDIVFNISAMLVTFQDFGFHLQNSFQRLIPHSDSSNVTLVSLDVLYYLTSQLVFCLG